MHDGTFDPLESALQESGIPPRHVRRMIIELQDHLDDLRREAANRGCDPIEAHVHAMERIGDQRMLARRVLEHPELRTWHYRHPLIARIYYPVACVLLLPLTPAIARWSAAMMLSATITAAMMLAMQLSISPG